MYGGGPSTYLTLSAAAVTADTSASTIRTPPAVGNPASASQSAGCPSTNCLSVASYRFATRPSPAVSGGLRDLEWLRPHDHDRKRPRRVPLQIRVHLLDRHPVDRV